MNDETDGTSTVNNDELLGRAKRAEATLKEKEDALRAEQQKRAELEAALAAAKAGAGTPPNIDPQRLENVEAIVKETQFTQRTNDLARMLNVDASLAKEILTYAGGDLNKASEAVKDKNSLFGKAVAQAQHEARIHKAMPSASSSFGGQSYTIDGKKVGFDDLPDGAKESEYARQVAEFQKQNPLPPRY